MEKTVFIAGATGYLGRYLVAEYMRRGWTVIALVRRREGAPAATRLIQAEATDPDALRGCMRGGVSLVVSALGITRQRDGVTYDEVDYRANANLLREALHAGVPRFAYVHVLHGEELSHLTAIAAKQKFVDELRSVKGRIAATVVAPSGFFSDMADFYDMARSGRVWLFGDGTRKINPIHGEDLATALADAVEEKRERLDVGGPDVYTQNEIAELAFDCIGESPRTTHVWDGLRTLTLRILPWLTPLHVYGPAQFFLSAMGMDMVGERHGHHHLRQHFLALHHRRNMKAQWRNSTDNGR